MKKIKEIYHKLQQETARIYIKLFKVEVIGVVGSVGKTTAKEMIRKVLERRYKVMATHKNIDPIYNIPLTIFKLRPGTEKLIIELSVDHFGDMDKYFRMVKPRIGVYTAISYTHTEFLESLDGVIKEKGKLAEELPQDGVLVINGDDENNKKIAKETRAKIYSYGFGKDNDFLAEDIKEDDLRGVSFTAWDKKRNEKIKIQSKLLGRQNVYSFLAAFGLARIYGIEMEEIKIGLELVDPVERRMNLKRLSNGAYLIDDSYNSSPIAVKAAVETVRKFKTKGKKIAVFGEMKELGKYGQKEHEKVAEVLKKNGFRMLIVFGELTKYTARRAKELGVETYEVDKMGKIIEILEDKVVKDDVILLKGSRHAHMERITYGLDGQSIDCDLVTCKKYIDCLDCEDI